ncbi:MAG: T9SS type A sorting domain-containing protein [Phycisphaerae bacterium]|nr:T9SS type A sorting domain-containing protein [Saprospiraceae bacterium]
MQIGALVRKIKTLVKELSCVLAPFHLKRILGPAALILGISFGTPAAAQSFAAPEENPFGIASLYTYAIPAVADLDGDGDLDLLSGDADNGGKLEYFENIGTSINPQFAAPVKNPFGITLTSEYAFPAFADLDHDGDLDLFVGDDNGVLRYYKNNGTAAIPQFAAPAPNPFGLTPFEQFALPSFVDIDGDGDLDLFVGEYGGIIQYFRNQGTVTNPQFAAPQQNPFGITSTQDVSFPTFADLDKDGDLDLLVGEYYGNMQYFKNTGSSANPQFAAPVENPFGLVATDDIAAPIFADLDGDGDMDLLVGEYYGDIQYFENTSPVGTQEQYANISLLLHPNPVGDVLNIQTDMPFEKVEAYDAMGKLFRNYHGALTAINVGDWSSGTYLLKFIDAKGQFVTRKLMKE